MSEHLIEEVSVGDQLPGRWIDGQWVLTLDEYEAINLAYVLKCIHEDGSKFNTGDWVYQVRGKLPPPRPASVEPNELGVDHEQETLKRKIRELKGSDYRESRRDHMG